MNNCLANDIEIKQFDNHLANSSYKDTKKKNPQPFATRYRTIWQTVENNVRQTDQQLFGKPFGAPTHQLCEAAERGWCLLALTLRHVDETVNAVVAVAALLC